MLTGSGVLVNVSLFKTSCAERNFGRVWHLYMAICCLSEL